MKRSPLGFVSRLCLALCLARCMFIAPLGSGPEANDGGTSSSLGGSSSGGGIEITAGAGAEPAAAGAGGATSTGGADSGGAPESGGMRGDGGDAGGPGEAGPCESNADCLRRAFDEPARCMPDKRCVALKSADCSQVIGNYKDNNAVYLGAYATNEPGMGVALSTESFTYQLAVNELNAEGHRGFPGGPGGTRRPLVMVVCDNNPSRLEPTLAHLTGTVKVPGILAALDVGPLLAAYERAPETFFLSPYGGSRDLSIKPDQGLIWSMLGQPSDFDAIYAATLARVEAFIKDSRGSAAPLRVATIKTDDAFSSELANAVLERLRFNDMSVFENLGENYLGRVLAVDDFLNQIGDVVSDVAEFQPDVVISLSNEAFVASNGFLPRLEDAWSQLPAAPPRPFYILSPKNVDTLPDTVGKLVKRQVDNGDPSAYKRFLALGAAPAADRELYNDFQVRLSDKYPLAHPEAENFYDATYFLMYSLYAAGNLARLSGSDLARGMLRLVSQDDRIAYDVGPTDLEKVFMALDVRDADLHLVGTLGPPQFDVGAGVRVESGSVTCFDAEARVHYHALRYDRAAEKLVGDFSQCYAPF